MWEGNYASEPFDLRLTVLRMVKNMGWLLLFTACGTLLLGGGYYVKNILLGEAPKYEKTITCKIEYTDPPTKSGDYYINEMTWNTYVDSEAFRDMLAEYGDMNGEISAKVASDIHIPSFVVSAEQADSTQAMCDAAEQVLTGVFADTIPEIAGMTVIDISDMELAKPDVRPLRAFVLSALLSGFLTIVVFLLRELGADSIWLPATLRRRYGLATLGTMESLELTENADYLFRGKQKIALCTMDDQMDPGEILKAIQNSASKALQDREWIVVPTPVLSPEAMKVIRAAEGVMLVVPAGLHAGKPLEYMLEFLKTQEIDVTAALLWEADETLIHSYYLLPGGRK